MCDTEDKSILVIDDNEDNLLLMQLMLDIQKHEVRLANCGRKGLAEIEKNCPDLIIVDLMMPDMSGSEVIERARANCNLNKTSILVLTANVKVKKQDMVDVDELCYKPFDMNVLLFKIQSLLSSKQHSPALMLNSI